MNKKVNHIEEYISSLKETSQDRASKELFKADSSDIDLKTDIDNVEISYINSMKMNDKFLNDSGLNSVFSLFIDNFLRLKVSKNRLSRSEFVKLNSQDKSDDMIEGIKTASSMFGGGQVK